jgi:hypothetical protein
VAPVTEQPFDNPEQERIAALDHTLVTAYCVNGSEAARSAALRCYLETMAFVGRRYPTFEIANHRVFRAANRLLVPYDAQGRLAVHAVDEQGSEVIAERRLPHGTLITDQRIAELAGESGRAIDLELEIYHLDVEQMPAIQVSRLRDLAGVLERLNSCGSRHEAVYLLRFLVARFCSTSYRGIASAKNLMPEITRVRNELIAFMNGPFADRLRLPTRILVRSISGMVSRPKLIDEVWQDTIDLAEVQVRGSTIANEIRRSTHHAMGKQTLKLAKAYQEWLQTGQALFPDPQREIPTEADPNSLASRRPYRREPGTVAWNITGRNAYRGVVRKLRNRVAALRVDQFPGPGAGVADSQRDPGRQSVGIPASPAQPFEQGPRRALGARGTAGIRIKLAGVGSEASWRNRLRCRGGRAGCPTRRNPLHHQDPGGPPGCAVCEITGAGGLLSGW